jgi:hypothetical protein
MQRVPITDAGPSPEPKVDNGKSPWHLEIPTHNEVFVGELAERADWIVANIHTDSYWPVKTQKVMYRGHAFWIIPLIHDHYPAVAMKLPPGKSRSECEELVMRFISNLSWVEDRGIMVEGIGGGNLPRPMARDKRSGFSICKEFDLSYFPDPASQDALLALALMREGRGLNHPAYAFLSFFRVLEVAFPNGRKRRAWVEANASKVEGRDVRNALDDLAKKGITDIGAHLFESGRCAVAHANRQPIVDPDKPDDIRRLSSELPIIKALAQKAIEDELGVETSQTVYRKHLYELAGFKEILGAEIVDFLTRGQQVTEQRMLEIPDICVRIRWRDPYPPLNNLMVKGIWQKATLLLMRFESKEGDVSFQFALDFGNERLEFSLLHDIAVKDMGTAESAERVAEVKRFEHDYFGNGQLHIVNADTGALIGRKDAYIPLNMYLDRDAADAEIARWKTLAEQRRHYSEAMERNARGYNVTVTLRLDL